MPHAEQLCNSTGGGKASFHDGAMGVQWRDASGVAQAAFTDLQAQVATASKDSAGISATVLAFTPASSILVRAGVRLMKSDVEAVLGRHGIPIRSHAQAVA